MFVVPINFFFQPWRDFFFRKSCHTSIFESLFFCTGFVFRNGTAVTHQRWPQEPFGWTLWAHSQHINFNRTHKHTHMHHTRTHTHHTHVDVVCVRTCVAHTNHTQVHTNMHAPSRARMQASAFVFYYLSSLWHQLELHSRAGSSVSSIPISCAAFTIWQDVWP